MRLLLRELYLTDDISKDAILDYSKGDRDSLGNIDEHDDE